MRKEIISVKLIDSVFISRKNIRKQKTKFCNLGNEAHESYEACLIWYRDKIV